MNRYVSSLYNGALVDDELLISGGSSFLGRGLLPRRLPLIFLSFVETKTDTL